MLLMNHEETLQVARAVDARLRLADRAADLFPRSDRQISDGTTDSATDRPGCHYRQIVHWPPEPNAHRREFQTHQLSRIRRLALHCHSPIADPVRPPGPPLSENPSEPRGSEPWRVARCPRQGRQDQPPGASGTRKTKGFGL